MTWVVVNTYSHAVYGLFKTRQDAESYRRKKEKAMDRSTKVMPGDYDVRRLRQTRFYDDLAIDEQSYADLRASGGIVGAP